MQGFHTARLLPANVDADQWVMDNALGFGKAYSFVVPDPDEGAAGVKAHNAVALPPASGCGDATDPRAYDGTQVVNSRLLPRDFTVQQFTFSVTINANAGTKISVLCLIPLAMRLDIAIVADTETATTQDEIDAFAGQKVVRDQRGLFEHHAVALAAGHPPRRARRT
jgi:hypothetical protein